MKYVSSSTSRVVLSFAVALGAALASNAHAVMQPTELVIQDVNGTATYSVAGAWQPLAKGMKLGSGAIIKTAADSTVDLLLPASATALRLTPDSALRLDKLKKEAAGEMTISETSVTLLAGAVAGTQRKLASPSHFQINMASGGSAHIVGTEYYVRADGAVSVVSGAVSINYNLPGNGGSVKVTITAGFSFDPATGKVVPTTPAYLQNIIAHINTTKHNAEVFKVSGGATLVVKPEEVVSPP
jgi:hypothetical protein